MTKPVNIEKCFELFNDTFSPKIVGQLNGQTVMLVRCEGDKVPWHVHDSEDEMFMVIDGTLEIQLRNRNITLHSGEFNIVPRGTEHRVVPSGHVKLMLFEPEGIAHTGKAKTEITNERFDKLEL